MSVYSGSWSLLLSVFFALSFCAVANADVGKRAFELANSGRTSEALTLLMKEENRDKPEALFMLGMMYDAGKGVERDLAKAFDYYLRSAERGHPYGQFYSGMFYRDGIAGQKDPEKAIYWLRKASEQKNTRAMGLLAVMLFDADKDKWVEAYAWAEIAAKYDPIQAQTSARSVIYSYLTDAQREEARLRILQFQSYWQP